MLKPVQCPSFSIARGGTAKVATRRVAGTGCARAGAPSRIRTITALRIADHLLMEEAYEVSGASAFLRGSLEICIRPLNGWYISRMRKIAPDADKAISTRATNAVGLSGVNRLKLTNRIVSQDTSTTRNGTGMPPLDCSNNTSRICRIALTVWMAWV